MQHQSKDIDLKYYIAAALLLLASQASAHQEDIPINTASELREWCRAESEASFIGQGITPYNWSASHWAEGNTLLVKGSWRVGTAEAAVDCRVAKGGQTRYATMSVTGP